jgi:hypothetical protein
MKPSLEVSDGSVVHRIDGIALDWSFAIKDILLIAEYTTDEGPDVDDYFLIFVTVVKGTLHFSGCSFYTSGRDEVFEELREVHGMPSEFGLRTSTEWASRVIWPIQLAGEQYFQFTEIKPVGLLAKLRRSIQGPQLEYRVRDSILTFLRPKEADL